MNKNGSFRRSLENAFIGIITLYKEERNIRIESVIGILAVIGCGVFRVTQWEWLAVLFCCMIVLSLEGMNSAIENAVDYTGEDIHPLAKKAKDIAAGAVLFASLIAVIVGMIIFVPYLLDIIFNIL